MPSTSQRTLIGLFALTVLIPAPRAVGFTLDDIDYWIGQGSQRVGIVIDWNGDDEPLSVAAPTLAWGYRWDGASTAEQALRDALADDPRLFAKLASVPGEPGVRLLGLGYDANDDGQFGIEADPLIEEFFEIEIVETFDPQTGLAASDELSFAGPTDPADAYDEGFDFNLVNPANDGFWFLSTTSGPSASGWAASGVGVSGQALQPETFFGLSFTPSYSFNAFPNNPAAAAPPEVGGDFNQDLAVTAADYAVWRDALGDPESLAAWQAGFGSSGASLAPAVTIPEPTSVCLLTAVSLCFPTCRLWR